MSKPSNDEIRRAIKAKVADVKALTENLTLLADESPDCVSTLAWSAALVRLEAIRKAAFALINTIALAGRDEAEARLVDRRAMARAGK